MDGTSYAASMTVLDGETAAERSQPLGLKAARNSLTQAENPALSDAGPASQSTLIINLMNYK